MSIIPRSVFLTYFFLSVHLCASANVVSGWAISTTTTTAFAVPYYGQEREGLPSSLEPRLGWLRLMIQIWGVGHQKSKLGTNFFFNFLVTA